MDNLAHAMFGALTSPVVSHRHYQRSPWRTLIAGASIANIPDIDILLMAFGREVYMFHHRGFSHSFLGLPVMLLLSLGVLRLILGKELWGEWGRFRCSLFVAYHLVVSHFLLDYLTTFGTMFLYPLSYERFSFPLMFIVDPLFWIACSLGLGLLWWKGKKLLSQPHWLPLLLAPVFLLWGVEFVAKQVVAKDFREELAVARGSSDVGKIETFPQPLAPLLWLALETRQNWNGDYTYHQGIRSLLQKKTRHFSIPFDFQQEVFCSGYGYPSLLGDKFRQYKRWASPILCREEVRDGKEGCACMSAKYSVAALSQNTFGGYWLGKDGESYPLPKGFDPNRYRLDNILRQIIEEPR